MKIYPILWVFLLLTNKEIQTFPLRSFHWIWNVTVIGFEKNAFMKWKHSYHFFTWFCFVLLWFSHVKELCSVLRCSLILLLHLFFHLSRTSGHGRTTEVPQFLKSHALYVRGSLECVKVCLGMDDLIEVMLRLKKGQAKVTL